ncbi:aryl-alcohol dehydrogenase [Artomyces pyxidatus]|uniref:Aryl-alcohol dehydrogenase n=1 Tax=Artomyces pyxidatus TaxID=48021 RepID=A0ACB8SG06_9AGAM|nr:aryl-alcohol dehydrogenase [Artomyces pyxidatus]
MSSLQVNRRVPYVRLGKSGLKVSQIILGCMSYGTPEWQPWVLGEKEAIEQIKFAYESGIQTFDTADIYSNGYSEIVLGKAIKELQLPRDEIVVMTKLWGVVSRTPGVLSKDLFAVKASEEAGYVNQRGLSRKHIFDSVKQSLARLQLDYIDVFQCHRFDRDTPIEETMQALHDVVQAGYVRYIGMSSCWAYQFHEMQNYAITHNLTPFISMQNQYSLLYREEEREMMPTLKHFGVGPIPWSPLARGALTRPLGGERTSRADNDQLVLPDNYVKTPSSQEVVRRVEELAMKYGVSMARISLAWVLSKDVVAAPIVGTTSVEKLKDLLGALDLKLTEEEIQYLEEAYKPVPVIGHM